MKKIALFLSVFAFISISYAQNIDGGATEILNKVSSKYQNYTSMQFNYTLKTTKNEKTLSVGKGDFIIKANKYKTTFDGQQIFCDGVSIWNYQKSTNEVSVYDFDPDDEQNILNPQNILKNWDKQFRAKFIRDEFSNNVQLSLIDLTPKTTQSYYRIRVFVNKTSFNIVKIAVYEKDNTIYTYSIEQFKSNVSLDDKIFTFDKGKYPNVEINDMR